MAAASQEALVKISAVLPAPAARRAEAVPVEAFAPPSALAARPFLDVLSVAINETRRVRLRYRDEAGAGTDRVVQPLGLYFWGACGRSSRGASCAMPSACSGSTESSWWSLGFAFGLIRSAAFVQRSPRKVASAPHRRSGTARIGRPPAAPQREQAPPRIPEL